MGFVVPVLGLTAFALLAFLGTWALRGRGFRELWPWSPRTAVSGGDGPGGGAEARPVDRVEREGGTP